MNYLSRSSQHVKNLFSHIAGQYDTVNNLMSCGMHHYWNRCLIKYLEPKSSDHYLDLCAGTGAIAKIYLKKIKPQTQIILLDFCAEMLEIAKIDLAFFSKTPPSFICADVCQIPLKDESIDRLSMAYGLRNIIDPQSALRESLRVMKPCAKLVILELTRPQNRWLQKLHGLWLKYVVARVASYYSRQGEAYAYLEESIHQFIEPETIVNLLQEAGFVKTRHISLTGNIASIFIAEKKPASILEHK